MVRFVVVNFSSLHLLQHISTYKWAPKSSTTKRINTSGEIIKSYEGTVETITVKSTIKKYKVKRKRKRKGKGKKKYPEGGQKYVKKKENMEGKATKNREYNENAYVTANEYQALTNTTLKTIKQYKKKSKKKINYRKKREVASALFPTRGEHRLYLLVILPR